MDNFMNDFFEKIIATVIDGITEGFKRLTPVEIPQKDEFVKIDTVCDLLKVSKPTVFAWRAAGKIPFYRIANRVYYKKDEILAALKKIERRAL